MTQLDTSRRFVRYILVLSLVLNVIFLGTGALFLYKKGGVEYLKSKLGSSSEAPPDAYALVRSSVFANLPKQKGIVFLGDSLTDNNEWQEFFEGQTIHNRGIGGETTGELLKRLDEIVQEQPSKLFIMIGTNDIAQGVSVSDMARNYRRIIQQIQSGSTSTAIYIQSILPSNSKLAAKIYSNATITEMNKEIENIAQSLDVTYVDLYSLFAIKGQLDAKYTIDGIHLNGEGYKVWVEKISPYLSASASMGK